MLDNTIPALYEVSGDVVDDGEQQPRSLGRRIRNSLHTGSPDRCIRSVKASVRVLFSAGCKRPRAPGRTSAESGPLPTRMRNVAPIRLCHIRLLVLSVMCLSIIWSQRHHDQAKRPLGGYRWETSLDFSANGCYTMVRLGGLGNTSKLSRCGLTGVLLPTTFHQRVVALIKRIPKGRVATYGQIAGLAGSPRGARQVVRTLHSSSDKERLPWNRVVNSQGRISLRPGDGGDLQRALLEAEGVTFSLSGAINLDRYLWSPRKPTRRKSKC